MKDAARDARDHEASNLKFKFKFELTPRAAGATEVVKRCLYDDSDLNESTVQVVVVLGRGPGGRAVGATLASFPG